MDPLVAVLTLVMMTVTIATIFSLVRQKGEGGNQVILGMLLGWALFLSPILFFGPTGAVLGMALVLVVGALVVILGRRYDRRQMRR